MQYIPKFYTIKELVNPEFLRRFSEAMLWTFFDPVLLKAADLIREKYGACFVNSGTLTDCGARLQESTSGAKYSAHKMFRALDLHIVDIENRRLSKEDKIKAYNDVRIELLTDKAFSGISFENGISWLHIDTYNRAQRIFNP